MKIRITDADYADALGRDFQDGNRAWRDVKEQARRITAQRLLRENIARQNAVCDELPQLNTRDPIEFARWMALQDEITGLFAEHDRLLIIAYPAAGKA